MLGYRSASVLDINIFQGSVATRGAYLSLPPLS